MKEKISDKQKLKELILYVADRSQGDIRFGATKLNKILFFADFLSYLRFGEAMTNQRYQKLENGPAPRSLLPVTAEMENRHEIAYRTGDYYGKKQRRIVPLRDPDLSSFSEDEIELVNQIIADAWEKNAAEMSQDSHQFIGWELAEFHEDIPYEVALVRPIKPTQKMMEYGASLDDLAAKLLESEEPSEKVQDHRERTVQKRTGQDG